MNAQIEFENRVRALDNTVENFQDLLTRLNIRSNDYHMYTLIMIINMLNPVFGESRFNEILIERAQRERREALHSNLVCVLNDLENDYTCKFCGAEGVCDAIVRGNMWIACYDCAENEENQ